MIAQIPQDRYQYCATCQTGFCGLFSAADRLPLGNNQKRWGVSPDVITSTPILPWNNLSVPVHKVAQQWLTSAVSYDLGWSMNPYTSFWVVTVPLDVLSCLISMIPDLCEDVKKNKKNNFCKFWFSDISWLLIAGALRPQDLSTFIRT